MLALLRFLMWVFARCVLSLRYRVRIHGLDKLRPLKGPLLVLPNHPAFIDPPLLLTHLWRPVRPRPLLFEGNFQNPILYPFMILLDALRVPDLDQTSAEARARTEQSIKGVIETLKSGRNVILWPSGYLQRTGSERLGAARTVADVLRAVPEANVVLIRTRGLWGSKFSYAYTGMRPSLGKRLLQGVGLLLANLLFFMPRRKVDLTVEPIDRKLLPELRRELLNPWIQAWYNVDGPEKPTFVPYHFLLGRRTHEFSVLSNQEELDLSRVALEAVMLLRWARSSLKSAANLSKRF